MEDPAQKHQQVVNENINKFWEQRIVYTDRLLQVDRAPFIVMQDTPISKLHFLFIMLSIS